MISKLQTSETFRINRLSCVHRSLTVHYALCLRTAHFALRSLTVHQITLSAYLHSLCFHLLFTRRSSGKAER